MRVSLCLLIVSGCLAMRLNPVGWSAQNHARLQALLDQPVSTAHGRAPVAAFDADGTLWSGDAYGAFSSVLVSKGLIDGDASAAVEREYGRSEEQERERWLLESFALFKGLRLEQLHAAAEEAWDGPGLGSTLRPEMADLVSCLRAAGWRVLIVTASPAEAVLRGAQALGVPEGDVLAVRLEADAAGVISGRPSPVMPLTWREGKAAALDAYGVAGRLHFAAGNSMDDLAMLRRSRGASLLCVPRPSAEQDPWCGAAEGPQRIAAVAAAEGHWLHEATAGGEEWRRLAWYAAQGEESS